MKRRIAVAEDRSAELLPIVSREQSENAFRAALNLFIGRGRRYSSKEVQIATGVSHRIIDCFRSYPLGHVDYRALNMGMQMSIIAFLGPDFTSEWILLAGQVAFHKPEGLDHDAIEEAARDLLGCKGKAHHPDSPGGREIASCELEELDAKVVALRARC
jgi:hypothetical protein